MTKSITDLYNKHCEIEYKKNENTKIEEHLEKAENKDMELKLKISEMKEKIRLMNNNRNMANFNTFGDGGY
jgi:predicted nuclease with TOPRIM domain